MNTLIRSLVVTASLLSAGAHADEWTGRDKTLHLGAGALVSASALLVTDKHTAFAIGTGVGFVKEVNDYRSRQRGGQHTPSAKDFAVTALGAALGAYAPGVVLGRRSISYVWSF